MNRPLFRTLGLAVILWGFFLGAFSQICLDVNRATSTLCYACSPNNTDICSGCGIGLLHSSSNLCLSYKNSISSATYPDTISGAIDFCNTRCQVSSCSYVNTTDLSSGVQCTQCQSGTYKYGTNACTWSCSDYPGTFTDTTNAACTSCSAANCKSCSSSSSDCQECDYSVQRFGSLSDISTYPTAVNTSALVCSGQPARSSTPITLTYFVSPQFNPDCSDSSLCDGSYSKPYDDITQVFVDLTQQLGNVLEATVNIYLLKGTHYWVDSDASDTNNHGINFVGSQAAFMLRAFERTSVAVTISPLFCDESTYTDTTLCVDDSSKVTIKLKSDLIFIYVTKSLTMSNIILDASQLVKYSSTTCKTSKQDCCEQDPTTLLYSSTSAGSAALCTMNNGPPASSSDRLLPSTYYDSTYLSAYRISKPNGFFNMQFLSDYPDAVIPTLTINNCEIRNFFYHQYASSFISLSRYGGKVNIQNTIFDNFMLPYGLISNGFTQRDRDLTNQTSYSEQHCKVINPSANYDYCHSITIQDSKFSNYNKQQFLLSTVNGYAEILNEGMVLFIRNVFGPIVIKNNTFQNMTSILRIPGTTTSYQCDDMYAGGSGTTPNGLGSMRENSIFKLYIDRHIDVYTQSSINSTGAVLNIGNVTEGLILYQNTFDSIIGMTGTALYLKGFNNTLTSPIIIQNNTFSNSFAYAFGLSFVIWSMKGNWAETGCVGIVVSSNIFDNNFGCPGAYGNAIISCLSIMARSNGYYTGAPNEGSYYDSSNMIYDEFELKRSAVFWLEFGYLWGNYSQGLISYNITSPIDGSVINAYQVSILNNQFSNNFATLTSGIAVVAAKDLYISGNSFVNNSIPVAENYGQETFQLNAFYTLLGGQVPAVPSETTYVFPRANSPFLARLVWKVQILNNTFSNNYAGAGLDFYFGSAITLDQMHGYNDVLISNCTFTNHQGFPASISNTDRGLYPYNTYPLVSINFGARLYESASFTFVAPTFGNLPSITRIYFDSCDVQNNTFNFVNNSTYYTSDPQYPNKATWILKYYFDAERNRTSIENDLLASRGTSGSGQGTFMVNLGIFINKLNLINNTDLSGVCWFHALFFMKFQITNSVFATISQSLNINTLSNASSSLICFTKEPSLEGFPPSRDIVISGLSVSDLNASFMQVVDRYQTDGPAYVTLRNIQIDGTYMNDRTFMLFTKIDIPIVITNFGINSGASANALFLLSSVKNISLSGVTLANIQTSSAAIFEIKDAVITSMSRLRLQEISHASSVLSQNVSLSNTLDPTTMYALLNITTSVITISDFVFVNLTSVNFYYALNSIIAFKGGLIQNSSSIVALLNTRGCQISVSGVFFNQISCEESTCISGLFASFSDTIKIKSSLIANGTGLDSLMSNSRLSQLSLNDTVLDSNTVQGSASCLTASLGTVSISRAIFRGNKANVSAVVYVENSQIQVENSHFLQNDALNQVKNIYTLDSDMTITDSVFVNYQHDSQAITDFIYTESGSLTVLNSGFYGGYGNSGAIFFRADITIANFTNCTFKDNTGFTYGGAISAMGIIVITNSKFDSNVAYMNGTQIHCEGSSTLTLQQITFVNTSGICLHLIEMNSLIINASILDGEGISQAVYCENCFSIWVQNSTFMNFAGGICGSALHSYYPASLLAPTTLSSVQFNLIDSSFRNNTANLDENYSKGGAICLNAEDPTVFFQGAFNNTVFTQNNALYSAGAVYYNCFSANCSITFKNTVFTENTAGAAGGAISFANQPFIIGSDSLFLDNDAPYGDSYSSYPVALSVLSSNANESRRLLDDLSGYDFVSGQKVTPPLRIALVDEFDQIYTLDNNSTLIVSATQASVQFLGQRAFKCVNGIYTLDELILETGIGQDFELSFQTNGISQISSRPQLLASSILKITPHFRNCTRGERISDDGRQCVLCLPGSYSLDLSTNDSCKTCDENLKCFGGDLIGPLQNYWRFSSVTETPQECPGDGCAGYYRPANATWEGWCKEPHNSTFCYTGWCNLSMGALGNLCAQCKDGWAVEEMTGSCIDCQNNVWTYLYSVAFILVIAGACIYVIYISTAEKNEEQLEDYSSDRLDTILWRILSNYIQMISIISNFPMDWPGQLLTFFQIYNQANDAAGKMFSFACFLESAVFKKLDIKPFFLKIIVSSIVPILITIISILVWISIYVFRFQFQGAEARFKKLKNKIITTIIVLLYTVHSNVFYISIQAFRCVNIGDDGENAQNYAQEDYSIECWTPKYYAFTMGFALPSLIFWVALFKILCLFNHIIIGAGIPLFAFFLLRANRSKLKEVDVFGRYGFIYGGYKVKNYYWEFIIMCRKMISIVIYVFLITYGIEVQAIIIIGLCAIGFYLQVSVEPYDKEYLNDLEKKSLLSSAIIIYCGLYFISNDLNNNWKSLLLVILIVTNVWFLTSWAVVLFRFKAQDLADKMKKLKRLKIFKFVSAKCSKYSKYLPWKAAVSRLYSTLIVHTSTRPYNFTRGGTFYDGVSIVERGEDEEANAGDNDNRREEDSDEEEEERNDEAEYNNGEQYNNGEENEGSQSPQEMQREPGNSKENELEDFSQKAFYKKQTKFFDQEDQKEDE